MRYQAALRPDRSAAYIAALHRKQAHLLPFVNMASAIDRCARFDMMLTARLVSRGGDIIFCPAQIFRG
jgi:hypothetical protein